MTYEFFARIFREVSRWMKTDMRPTVSQDKLLVVSSDGTSEQPPLRTLEPSRRLQRCHLVQLCHVVPFGYTRLLSVVVASQELSVRRSSSLVAGATPSMLTSRLSVTRSVT